MDIVLSLRGMRVILGIDDQYLIASCEHDVTLHDPAALSQSHHPRPMESVKPLPSLADILGIVFEDKFLIQAVHTLLIDEGSQLIFSGVCGQEHSFQNKLTQTDEHTIGIVVPLETNG